MPEAEVTWFRNKSKLGSPHHLHEGSLLLTNVSFSDQGLYSCRAANVRGELTENSQLQILGKHLEAGTPIGRDCLTHPAPPLCPDLIKNIKVKSIFLPISPPQGLSINRMQALRLGRHQFESWLYGLLTV